MGKTRQSTRRNARTELLHRWLKERPVEEKVAATIAVWLIDADAQGAMEEAGFGPEPLGDLVLPRWEAEVRGMADSEQLPTDTAAVLQMLVGCIEGTYVPGGGTGESGPDDLEELLAPGPWENAVRRALLSLFETGDPRKIARADRWINARLAFLSGATEAIRVVGQDTSCEPMRFFLAMAK